VRRKDDKMSCWRSRKENMAGDGKKEKMSEENWGGVGKRMKDGLEDR
jgi:hypothetical protein